MTEPGPPLRDRALAHVKVVGWALLFAALAYGAVHILRFLIGLTGLKP
jgi:hypothetical protein